MVVGIILVAVLAKKTDTTGVPVTAAPDSTAAVPKGVLPAGDPNEFGVPFGVAAAGAPILSIWEDYQCPSCGALEIANGKGIAQLATDGKVQLIWRPTTFIDGRVGNDASARAVAAWGCAIDAGMTREYHDAVYANQPKTEGDGYSNEQLIGFGTTAGLSGAELDTFTTCVNNRTYVTWAANGLDAFKRANVPGTPAGYLNGVPLADGVLADQVALEKAITDAAAAK